VSAVGISGKELEMTPLKAQFATVIFSCLAVVASVSKLAANERFAVQGTGGAALVRAAINGVKGNFLIDTAAPYVTVSGEFATRANLPRLAGAEIRLQTTNGLETVILTKAESVKLGGLKGDSVPVVIEMEGKPLGKGIDGLLGMSFLSRFELHAANGFIEINAGQASIEGGAAAPAAPATNR
jgi:clan AA aspartic protease (TIGR02281 family)